MICWLDNSIQVGIVWGAIEGRKRFAALPKRAVSLAVRQIIGKKYIPARRNGSTLATSHTQINPTFLAIWWGVNLIGISLHAGSAIEIIVNLSSWEWVVDIGRAGRVAIPIFAIVETIDTWDALLAIDVVTQGKLRKAICTLSQSWPLTLLAIRVALYTNWIVSQVIPIRAGFAVLGQTEERFALGACTALCRWGQSAGKAILDAGILNKN